MDRQLRFSPGSGSHPSSPKSDRGFSFIEMLMVVAVISLLSALAVPHLQRVRMSSQENVAIASLRAAYKGELLHLNQFQRYGDLSELVASN